MALHLDREKDPEIVRKAALILERENQRLVDQNLALRRELLTLKGGTEQQLALEISNLEEQLRKMRERMFGDSSEKRPRDKDSGKGDPASKSGHGRREQPELPIVPVVHDVDEADRTCTTCGGGLEPWEGQDEISEEIDVVERSFVIKKHMRRKWRCKCGGCIETAPAPEKLTPHSRYSIDFAIEVVVSKYLDHQPLERQVRVMAREGLIVDSQTLWDQVDRVAHLLLPAYQTLRARVLGKPVIGADETRWRLMGKRGEDAGEATRWQVWIASAPDAVFYDFQDSRSADAAKVLLGEYAGVVVCDGYSAYGALKKRGGRFQLAHCWAHVRRKYVEIEPSFPVPCKTALDLIGEIYEVERRCRAGPDGDEERRRLRAEVSRGVLAKLKAWAMETLPTALPESGLAGAIKYMLGLWSGLERFLDDPRIPVDNNATERAARGVVVGRKNHYGSKSERGTKVAAILYSLLETAKLAGVEPKA
ncbi:MAG: IS66 family transposase, partial [Solirubrobacterales bacterium]